MLNENDLRPGDVIQDAMGDFWHVHDDGKIWCSEPGARISFDNASSAGPFAYAPGCGPKWDKRAAEWTLKDLPNIGVCQSRGLGYGSNEYAAARVVLDAVVDWLNDHHPKPAHRLLSSAAECVLGAEDRVRSAKAERDAAVTRAEKAEKRHTWPKTTPTGHTYVEPRTYEALCHEHDNAAQADVECWEADECPPEPTWEMVGIAHREVEGIRCGRDEWKARAEAAERSRGWFRDRAEAAEARTAPAVTHADIEKVVADWVDDAPEIVNEVWSLVSGSDPAVHVVRESDIAAVKVTEHTAGWSAESKHLVSGWGKGKHLSVDMDIDRYRAELLNALAVQRAIEAEQAVDPVEEKAEELMRVLAPETEDRTWGILTEPAREDFRRLARHVLGREDR